MVLDHQAQCELAKAWQNWFSAGKGKKPTIYDAMNLLENGFLQAGSGGARDLLKGNVAGMWTLQLR